VFAYGPELLLEKAVRDGERQKGPEHTLKKKVAESTHSGDRGGLAGYA
jgi:hypothetical protein